MILAEARLAQLYPKMGSDKFKPEQKAELFDLLETFKGSALVGLKYQPLFPYFKERAATGAFRVVSDGYVTSDSGTGIVHQAPAFGEDDYRVCLENGIIAKGVDVPCPVDANGRFTADVPEYAGKHVKEVSGTAFVL